MQLFRPILPGTTIIDRVVACIAAMIGIAATGLATRWMLGSEGPASLMMVASMGASAVLVFAVPASPLAQPW
ncbi:HPP family protein, partial [Brevundimonas sp. DWP1b2]